MCRPQGVLGPRAVVARVMGRYDDTLRRGPEWIRERAAGTLALPTL